MSITKLVLVLGIFSLCAPTAFSQSSIFDSLYTWRGREIYFASGKADLNEAANRQLDSIATRFGASPSLRFRITAHTDSVGTSAFNKSLSTRRAEAVKQALVERGIGIDQIQMAAFGEAAQVSFNSTEDGRQRNRRATIEVQRPVPMATFSGQVKDSRDGKGVQATISFSGKTRRDSVKTDENGRYSARLPKDSIVTMEVLAKDYFFKSQVFKVFGSPELYKKYKIDPDIILSPAVAGEKVVLKDLFFVGDSAILLKASEPQLPVILAFMRLNSDLRIEIAGHINGPNLVMEREPSWRRSLSQRRAKLVFDYLLKNGIAAARITYKGYENKEMLYPQPRNDWESEQNRRVEIRVVGKME
jgi:outer membrane protein OmpA-like peptidoglycan-associated protein